MKPEKIRVLEQGRLLELGYADQTAQLSAEYLRTQSPSAEVQGHFGQGGSLPEGKQHVRIQNITRSGHYALIFSFSDGHDSGIYSWPYLRELVEQYPQRWQQYLDELNAKGGTRDPDIQPIKFPH